MKQVIITSERSQPTSVRLSGISLTTAKTPTGLCINGYHVWVKGNWVGVYQTYNRARAEHLTFTRSKTRNEERKERKEVM